MSVVEKELDRRLKIAKKKLFEAFERNPMEMERKICKIFPCYWCGFPSETHYTDSSGREHFVCFDCLKMLSNKDKEALCYKLWNLKRVPIVVHTHDGRVFLDIKDIEFETETEEQSSQRRRVWLKLLGICEDND